MGFVQEFAKYCNVEEGWRRGLPSWVNNNPLNLDAPTPRSVGRDSHGRAVFKSVADGWADAESYIASHITHYSTIAGGLTLNTFFAGQRSADGKVIAGGYSGFAPVADARGKNEPNAYADALAHGLGIDPSAPLLPFLDPGGWPPRPPPPPAPAVA
jgi:hypothetical protein